MADSKKSKECIYKIQVLGDWSVGKSCFIMKYTNNTFSDTHLTTIGIEFKYKDVKLDNGKIVKIQIWDTAGQERYRSITKNCIKRANGIILIYDITNKETFEGITNWVKQIKEEVSSKVCVALVGNKIDLSEKRQVSEEEGRELSEEIKYPFYEVSAKEGTNINECFDNLVKQVAENFKNSSKSKKKLKKKNTSNDNSECC